MILLRKRKKNNRGLIKASVREIFTSATKSNPFPLAELQEELRARRQNIDRQTLAEVVDDVQRKLMSEGYLVGFKQLDGGPWLAVYTRSPEDLSDERWKRLTGELPSLDRKQGKYSFRKKGSFVSGNGHIPEDDADFSELDAFSAVTIL